MRLPHFRFESPRSVAEAAELLAGAPAGEAMLVAGGTDLLPNMKRRQQTPRTLIGLRRVAELRQISNGSGLRIGAGVTLAELIRLRQGYGGHVRLRQGHGAERLQKHFLGATERVTVSLPTLPHHHFHPHILEFELIMNHSKQL